MHIATNVRRKHMDQAPNSLVVEGSDGLRTSVARKDLAVGIMDRLSRLIRANINYELDRAEDPEKMLGQILRDMQSSNATARAQTVAMIAQEKELEAELAQTRRLAAEWGYKAGIAVSLGKDDLARQALRRKFDNEENGRVYEQQLNTQKQVVARLKDQLGQLEIKYQAMLSRREVLVARHRLAAAQETVAKGLTSISETSAPAEMERMERKIRSQEARANAMVELTDNSFDAQILSVDGPRIEAELQALKARTPAASVSPARADMVALEEFGELEVFDIDAEIDALKSGL
jgi:phage shock protein A